MYKIKQNFTKHNNIKGCTDILTIYICIINFFSFSGALNVHLFKQYYYEIKMAMGFQPLSIVALSMNWVFFKKEFLAQS